MLPKLQSGYASSAYSTLDRENALCPPRRIGRRNMSVPSIEVKPLSLFKLNSQLAPVLKESRGQVTRGQLYKDKTKWKSRSDDYRIVSLASQLRRVPQISKGSKPKHARNNSQLLQNASLNRN